jgi:hypothetical protein
VVDVAWASRGKTKTGMVWWLECEVRSSADYIHSTTEWWLLFSNPYKLPDLVGADEKRLHGEPCALVAISTQFATTISLLDNMVSSTLLTVYKCRRTMGVIQEDLQTRWLFARYLYKVSVVIAFQAYKIYRP